MKYFVIFLIVFNSFLMSCDGRTSKSEFLKSAISEFNKKHQIQNAYATYTPREYTEIATDTIIENKINIHIKNYSLMDENVIISPGKNTQKSKYHRSFESEIVVYSASKIWFKTRLNAKTFADNKLGLFWNNATLQHTWINQDESNEDHISILVSFINPTTKSYRLYQLYIDETGLYKSLLKENSI